MKNKESQNFDKVMDALLSVPYSELQEKLEEEKKLKAERKKRGVKIPPVRRVSNDLKS